MAVSAATLERFKAIVGPNGVIDDPRAIAPFLEEQRGLFRGTTPLVLRPGTTAEVARIVALAAETGTGLVPQGGNTGLVGGAVPAADGSEIIVNLARMSRVRALDPINNTIEVEAGCVLADIQAKASDAERLFPLSLAAEGSCQIGGNLSTNAGGTNVLRYGNARNLVLGLEVVLANGEVWNGLRGLRKDNTGYDLKHLFIGAEGTLGIITAAVLKLFPQPREVVTAMIALADPAAALALLGRVQAATGDAVTAWEFMPRHGLDLTLKNVPGNTDPFAVRHAWYVLAEIGGSGPAGTLRTSLEQALEAASEDGGLVDAVIAANETQAAALWRIRETMPEAQKREGSGIRHDVAVPVSRVPDFIRAADSAVAALRPGTRIIAYGHLGDGNVHYNLSPELPSDAAFLTRRAEFTAIVHDTAVAMGGTISAEHGLGLLKRDENRRYKSATEFALMRMVKAALDPKGIMNPGKML